MHAVKLAYVGLFGGAAVSCFLGAWRARAVVDRDTRAGLVTAFALSGLWASSTVARLLAPSQGLSLGLRLVGLVVGLASVGAWLYFASAYAGHDYHRRRGVRSVALSAFAVTAVLKVTTPIHGLYFTSATAQEPFTHLLFEPGIAYWLVAGAAYALVGVGLFWLFDSVPDSHVDTGRFGAGLLLTAVPALLDVAVYLREFPPLFLEVSYAPLGMAVFALGTLAATDSEFRPVPRFWHRTVLRELSEAVVVVDSDERVKHASRAAVERFPELADAVGRPFDQCCPTLSEATRDDAAFTRETAGEPRHYRAIEQPLTAGGAVAGRAYVFTDVTESVRTKQRLETNRQELQRFRHAVESAGHAIFLTAPDGTIEYVNPAFESITGYDREEAVGRTPNVLNSDEMSDRFFDRLWQTILRGETWDRELLNRRKDGTLYHAHQTIAPVTDGDGDIDAFVSIQTDISDRNDREQQLRVLGRVLRHNIRNTMNVVRGRAELFRDGDVTDAQSQGEKIVEQSDKLLEVTQKEQAITKVLLDSPNRRPVAVQPLLTNTVTDVHAAHPHANFSVECQPSTSVLAAGRLEVAIEELLTNAVVHSETASPNVSVTVTEQSGVVDIEIRDEGPHIPGREQEVLAHGSTVDELFHGTGLGLWVVYWIVKQSSGSVAVTTRVPVGNTVTVSLQSADDAV